MWNLFKNKSNATADQSEQTTPKRFFSVALSSNHTQAALWETDEQVTVLAKSAVKEYIGETDLLVKLDQALQELGPEGEPVHQTLFHLDSSLISGSDIAADKRALFDLLTEKLQLESLGFVTNTEGVVNAKLELNPEITRQLVIEWTPDKVVYSLYEAKTLLDSATGLISEDFATQFKGVLVQWASQLGDDYSRFFESSDLSGSPLPPSLIITAISSYVDSSYLQQKLALLPASLPQQAEALGSEIILSYVLVPSATLIARSYGWLTMPEPEPEPEPEPMPAAQPASIPPTPAVQSEPPLILSRQKNFTPSTVTTSDFTPEKKAAEATSGPSRKMSKGAKIAVAISVVLLALVVSGVVGFYVWLHSATATVWVVPERAKVGPETIEVVIDPEAKTADNDSLTLPGTIEKREISVEFNYTTTGKNNVGEPAHGKVELRNKQTKEVRVEKGTIIENGTVSFSLNDTVTVPAAEDKDSSRVFGIADVDVTAVTIGESGNIAKDTSLRVGSAVKDDIEAVTKEKFSGGSDKYTQVFSTEDEKAATIMAKDKLEEEAAGNTRSSSGGTYYVPQLSQLDITAVKFDAKVGEETDTVLVTAVGDLPVVTYKLDGLQPLVESQLQKKLPAGYEFIGEPSEPLHIENKAKTAKGNGKIYVDVTIEQAIQASLDVASLKQSLLGKPVTQIDSITKNYGTSIAAWELTWDVALAGNTLGNLPDDPDKLQVVLSEELPSQTKTGVGKP